MVHVLEETLRLLHPFMPFITEEIWQKLPGTGQTIMTARFPEYDASRHDVNAEVQMKSIRDIIASVRNIRGEMNIKPGLQVKDFTNNWIDVKSDYGSLIVNIGDMLQKCSKGHYPSTSHRVINPKDEKSNQSRFSMPFFLHPRDEVSLSDGYTAKEYLDERLKQLGLKK